MSRASRVVRPPVLAGSTHVRGLRIFDLAAVVLAFALGFGAVQALLPRVWDSTTEQMMAQVGLGWFFGSSWLGPLIILVRFSRRGCPERWSLGVWLWLGLGIYALALFLLVTCALPTPGEMALWLWKLLVIVLFMPFFTLLSITLVGLSICRFRRVELPALDYLANGIVLVNMGLIAVSLVLSPT